MLIGNEGFESLGSKLFGLWSQTIRLVILDESKYDVLDFDELKLRIDEFWDKTEFKFVNNLVYEVL